MTRRRRTRAAAKTSAAGRWLSALLLLPVLALSALAIQTLVADLQFAVVDAKLAGVGWRVDPLQTIRDSAARTPWRSSPRLSAARVLSTTSDLEGALRETEAALARDPASAGNWLYLARLRGTLGRFDAQTRQAYEHAVALEPNADHIHWAIALDGILRWRHGDDALRAVWNRSIAFNLERKQRNALLRVVIDYGKERPFCANQRAARPDLVEWCDWIQPVRATCLRPDIPRKSATWCRSIGFPTVVAPG